MAAKAIRGISRMARSRTSRRNTLDCALLNEIFIDDDTKKSDKRSMQLLRESERDLKLSSGIIYPITGSPTSTLTSKPSKPTSATSKVPTTIDDRSENSVLVRSNATKLIETGNRFMSVNSRPVGCRASAPAQAFSHKDLCATFSTAAAVRITNDDPDVRSEKSMLQTRQEFHETFANLIKLGSSDKQESKLSTEDASWQTELKDMIWLELQAWHADRTLEQQDKFLYKARQEIPDLLNKILNYR